MCVSGTRASVATLVCVWARESSWTVRLWRHYRNGPSGEPTVMDILAAELNEKWRCWPCTEYHCAISLLFMRFGSFFLLLLWSLFLYLFGHSVGRSAGRPVVIQFIHTFGPHLRSTQIQFRQKKENMVKCVTLNRSTAQRCYQLDGWMDNYLSFWQENKIRTFHPWFAWMVVSFERQQ